MLNVELDSEDWIYLPGSMLTGRIVWEMAQVPKIIEASLTWETEGKGDEDCDIAIEQTWTPSTATGTQAFRWKMPRGPLSLDGTLIRIRWSIQCTSKRPDENCSKPIVLSHLKRPLILTTVK